MRVHLAVRAAWLLEMCFFSLSWCVYVILLVCDLTGTCVFGTLWWLLLTALFTVRSSDFSATCSCLSTCLWTVLLLIHCLLIPPPPSAFCCHDSGATVLALAPRHQLLITGGKKGWISMLDLPHKHQRQSFQAHDSPVKALAVDPTEDCFISGSSEGNIRVFLTPSLRVSVSDPCSAEAAKLKAKLAQGEKAAGPRRDSHPACWCRSQGRCSKDDNTSHRNAAEALRSTSAWNSNDFYSARMLTDRRKKHL